MLRKAPIKVSGEKIYLSKEKKLENYVSDGRQQNAFLSKKENTYYIMNWLSFDMKKCM